MGLYAMISTGNMFYELSKI